MIGGLVARARFEPAIFGLKPDSYYYHLHKKVRLFLSLRVSREDMRQKRNLFTVASFATG